MAACPRQSLFLLAGLSGVALFAFCRLFPAEARQYPFIRCARAGWCLACICVDYKLWGNREITACHARSAQRLLRLAEANRGVYIKLGQHAAAMVYLLPPAYTETLSVLQSEAPHSSLEDVYGVLKKDLGVHSLEEIFEEFDPRPVGAASLAQVHFARLRDGSPVAVKVQHREVADLARADAQVVKTLEEIAQRIFPEVKLRWLAELLETNLPQEVDFLNEAANAERLRSLLEKQSCLSYSLPSAAYNALLAPYHLVSLFSSFRVRWRSMRPHSPPASSPDVSLSASPASVAPASLSPQPHESAVCRQSVQGCSWSGEYKVGTEPETAAPGGRARGLAASASSHQRETARQEEAEGESEGGEAVHFAAPKAAKGRESAGDARDNTPLSPLRDGSVRDYEIQLRVPNVYRELSTSRVLVMERAPGVSVDDLEGLQKQRIHPLAVSHALNRLFEALIFREGFVHADPHPGNILVHLQHEDGERHRQEGRMRGPGQAAETKLRSPSSPSPSSSPSSSPSAWSSFGWFFGLGNSKAAQEGRKVLTLYVLDNGLYCQLSKEFREHYARLWLGVLRGDRRETDACCRFFGVEQLAGLLQIILTLRSETSLKGGISRSRKSVEEDQQLRASFPEYFTRITEVLQSVPREFVLLIKTNDLLRAIQQKLGLDERLALLPIAHGSYLLATECILDKQPNLSFFWRWWILLRLRLTLWGLNLAERLLARRALQDVQETDQAQSGKSSHGPTNSALDALSGVLLALV
ncbi:conserved hypothetical protein [Neospora caninum Liverpool]|uniref:ABC1 atypical kinase-like domain-containing protein n=1 Tax=Neospora caninum (strain Liverpool) TaxID=572307 RepID=F0VFJ0_NEOCL|nr:conserved hypothetical protein [Neospora caninum Liverpool]CBZ52484.1 conserved hypothetical protein [Neospora caninum Liverpool]|eukprot:XP_003882516.1 conserved hypothetical protein [Neospora caninum Liverpool]